MASARTNMDRRWIKCHKQTEVLQCINYRLIDFIENKFYEIFNPSVSGGCNDHWSNNYINLDRSHSRLQTLMIHVYELKKIKANYKT